MWSAGRQQKSRSWVRVSHWGCVLVSSHQQLGHLRNSKSLLLDPGTAHPLPAWLYQSRALVLGLPVMMADWYAWGGRILGSSAPLPGD